VVDALEVPPDAMIGPGGVPAGAMKKEKGGIASAMIVDPADLPPGLMPHGPAGARRG
jgi:hypothetical protein